jgi:DNA-binding PadR family transcriptional regulator
MSAAANELADAPDDGDLTRFQFETLYFLAASGPTYGLGIKRGLEGYYGSEVNHGRLYPNLNDLVEAGLVEKSAIDKRTNEYGLTADGRELVRRDAQRRHGIADGMGGDE